MAGQDYHNYHQQYPFAVKSIIKLIYVTKYNQLIIENQKLNMCKIHNKYKEKIRKSELCKIGKHQKSFGI